MKKTLWDDINLGTAVEHFHASDSESFLRKPPPSRRWLRGSVPATSVGILLNQLHFFKNSENVPKPVHHNVTQCLFIARLKDGEQTLRLFHRCWYFDVPSCSRNEEFKQRQSRTGNVR